MMKVRFIGLGSMGAPIARRLARAGFDVTGCDISPVMLEAFDEPGTRRSSDPLQTARDSDLLGVCVRTDEQIEGQLSLWIGGEDADVERARPWLEAIGKKLSHLGPVGRGQKGKLINNLISIANYGMSAAIPLSSAKARLLLASFFRSAGVSNRPESSYSSGNRAGISRCPSTPHV